MTRTLAGRCLLLWLVCMVTYGYFSSVINGNVQTRTALALSLAEQHVVNINAQARFTTDKAFVDGNYYSDKAPGLSLLSVPIALALSKVFDPGGQGDAWVRSDALSPKYGMLVFLLNLLTVGLISSFAVVATYRWNVLHGISQTGAMLAAVTLGFATPALGWATMFFGHMASGSLLLVGFFGLTRASESAAYTRAPLLGFGAGLALGAAFTIEFPAGPAVAIIGIACACAAIPAADRWIRIGRVFVPAAIGLLLAIAPLPLYNDYAFHSAFKLGYESVQSFPGMKEGFFGVRLPNPWVAAQLIGGLYRGLLPLSPVLLLFPFAAFVAAQNRSLRLSAIVGGLVFLYYLAMNSGYFYWDGGYSTGPRHMLPALPFMTLLLGQLWDLRYTPLRAAFIILLTLSGAISLVCASVDIVVSPDFTQPFTQYILPEFLNGHLHRLVVGRLLPNVNAFVVLLPLLLIWLVVGWLLFATRQDGPDGARA